MIEQLVPEIEARLKAQLVQIGKESGAKKDEFEEVGILIRPKFTRDAEGKITDVQLCYEGKFKGETTREISMLEVLNQEVPD